MQEYFYEKRKSGFFQIMLLFLRHKKLIYTRFFILILISIFEYNIRPNCFKNLVNEANTRNWDGLKKYFFIYTIISLGLYIFYRFSEFLGVKIQLSLKKEVAIGTLRKIFKENIYAFSHGELASAPSRSVESMNNVANILKSFENVFLSIISIFVSMLTLLQISNFFFVITTFWQAIFWLFFYISFNKTRLYAKEATIFKNSAWAKFFDLLKNIKLVKIFNKEDYEIERSEVLLTRYTKAEKKKELRVIFSYSVQGIGFIIFFYYTCANAIAMLERNSLDLGKFSILLTTLILTMNLMWRLAQELFKIAETVGISDASISISIKDEESFSKDCLVKGNRYLPVIQIKNLTFSYHERKIFDKFNLEINSGEKIAIIGKSGSGKSTLANILVNFYKSYTGEVFVCGKDIKLCTQDRIIKYISIMPQESSLFASSILENLCYGNYEISQHHLHEICADLNIEEYIKKEKIYSIDNLCGGDKQKICLARTLIKPSKIIILDEPFSQLDDLSKKKSWATVDKYLDGRTLIVLCHEPPLYTGFDRDIYLK